MAKKSPLIEIARQLATDVDRLSFGAPVAYVYNPLAYAWTAHARYLQLYGSGPKEALFVGMNPGPFGMAQTGVPFGEVAAVRDFLGISESVARPMREHPKRPILGFECPRSEISGARFWGFFRDRFATPARFFARFFVANYCPLVFVEDSGKNRTPDKLPAAEREPLLAICDEALARMVDALAVRHVIGIGAFATQASRRALAGRDVSVGTMLHPSPASPRANRDWAGSAALDLAHCGLRIPEKPPSGR
ncbi:MAG: single-strand selective monofunctional uracil-DNA glycosylase [Myxococcales bacterium]|nr:single-strand selective monofunctional uracil-DNA glycosylase [Myxococcales bacterium]